MRPVIDPRDGDIEDDASNPSRHSLMSLAGSLLAEISFLKLATAWIWLIIMPGLLLGLAPIVASVWLEALYSKISAPFAELWPAVLLLAIIIGGLLGGRTLLRLAETSFWSLNALAVQPGYMACREGLRHVAERWLPAQASSAQRDRLRSVMAAVAGAVVCALALLLLAAAWQNAHLLGDVSKLNSARQLAHVIFANSVVIIAGYLAITALIWGIADASISQPRDFDRFCRATVANRQWRIAHLSDLHVVGERYGFRIESGRSGPRGNELLLETLAQLESIHAEKPLDAILVTGDLTDAGRSSEWAEFFAALAAFPTLAERLLLLPGNHDLNIVDRANPARLDLPTSPNKKLRKLRLLSAMLALQGERVRVVDREHGRLGQSLQQMLSPHLKSLVDFADCGKPRLSGELPDLWARIFPLVLPPERDDGMGIMLLDSNSDSHFSFTNALGMISVEQLKGIEIARAQYPEACWIIALHHHLIEYPQAAKAFSERIGTALINGNWFIRRLQPWAERMVLLHGHRHFDWIGECGGLRIVSAPSPVMNAGGCFYVHTFAVDAARRLQMLPPQRVPLQAQAERRAGEAPALPAAAERD
jgi:Calcineurin-like phosphoesterase